MRSVSEGSVDEDIVDEVLRSDDFMTAIILME